MWKTINENYLYLSIIFLFTTAPATAATFSLSDCLNRIPKSSVQLAQAVVNEARAKSALDEANTPKLPQLVAQGNLAVSSDIVSQAVDANKAVIRLEQGTLPFGSAWKLGNQRALEIDLANLGTIETQQDVEFLVKQLYFSILRDQDLINNSNAVEAEFKRLLAAVIPRFQMGRAPSFDMVKVKSSLYDLVRTREVIASQLMGEKSQLAQVIGLSSLEYTLLPIKNTPDFTHAISASGGTPTQVVENNPTLVGLSKSIEVADSATSVAKSARIPTLSAALEYGLSGQTTNSLVNSWTGFAQIRFPIFDWGLISSQVAQAEASKILAEKKLESERQRITSDLVQTDALADAHLADQKRLEALLPELKRASKTSIERYGHAAVGIIEATDSVGLWLQNILNERTAYYAYLSDLAHLERLTGSKMKVNYGI